MKRAVFLDRDGVVNRPLVKNGKPCSPRTFERFELYVGVKDILELYRQEGFLNIVVSNQPDIARGLMSLETLEQMHEFVRNNLPIDDILICPHDDGDGCDCRKPKSGLLLTAAREWQIDLKSSFMIGDQWKDVEAGRNAGCTTILLDYAYNQDAKPDFRAQDLWSAAEIVLCARRETYGLG